MKSNETMSLAEALCRATVSVPVAGRVFYGLGRNGSYEAAKRGEIPTAMIGRKKRAIVALIAQKLGLRATAGQRDHDASAQHNERQPMFTSGTRDI
jgi:hypothetical protein